MVALNAPSPAQPNNGWGLLPAEIICDPKIKDGAIRLYAFLATRTYNADKNDRNILTRKEIATQLEISESTVTNRVRELVERDWILVWEVGRSNAYMTYKTPKECREAREANPDRAYVVFDKVPDLRVARINIDKGNQLPHSKRAERKVSGIRLVQPVAQTEVTSSLSSDNQLHHSEHISLIQKEKEINTDIAKAISTADAGVDHVIAIDNMVEQPQEESAQSGGALDETYEKTPNPVPLPPSPAIETVNASGATVITQHDPLFDSIALLQFNIADTTALPKKRVGRRTVRSLIQDIEDAIVSSFKAAKSLSANSQLSNVERDYLTKQHAKFWTWWQEVKYPPKPGNKPLELRKAITFEIYWQEYRQYAIAQHAATKSKPKQHDPHCHKCGGYGTVYYIAPPHDQQNKRLYRLGENKPAGWIETSDDCDCEVIS